MGNSPIHTASATRTYNRRDEDQAARRSHRPHRSLRCFHSSALLTKNDGTPRGSDLDQVMRAAYRRHPSGRRTFRGSRFARLAAVHERFFSQHCKITCYIRLLGILRARPGKYQRHHTIIFRMVALGVSTARTRHRHRPPSKAIYSARQQCRHLKSRRRSDRQQRAEDIGAAAEAKLAAQAGRASTPPARTPGKTARAARHQAAPSPPSSPQTDQRAASREPHRWPPPKRGAARDHAHRAVG